MSGAANPEELPAMQIRCPHCHHPIEVVDEKLLEELACPACGSNITLISRDTTVGHDETLMPSTARLEPRSLGHFELLEQVGVGGFGAVWKARDTVLDRIVALKIPRRSQLTSAEAEYFLRDARAAAQLRHSNIVSVHEVGRDGETFFIASDFIDGASLLEWLSARKLTVREAAALVAEIAEAVQHAHERGVVHRDLKPGNILMDSAGRPHVTDFGLAKRETGEITMTVDGQILGTPAYMSPEQARGKAHEADATSDVYSLGVILFELLTGELPFRGEKRMLILQILNDEPPSPRKLNSRVPRDLETICLKCLEKDAKKRYASMAELAMDLRRFLTGQAISARPVKRLERVWRWCKRQPVVAALVATVFVSLAAGTCISAYFGWNESVQRERAQGLLDQKSALAADLASTVDEQELQLSKLLFGQAWSEYSQGHPVSALHNVVQSLTIVDRMLRRAPLASESRTELLQLDQSLRYQLIQFGLAATRTRTVRLDDFCHAIAFSPDGSRLATASGDTARLWDVTTGQSLGEPMRHEDIIYRVAFSPDGARLATASADLTARLWDVATGKQLCAPLRHEGIVHHAAFSPDGLRLATASTIEGTVRLWDVATGNSLGEPLQHQGIIDDIAFSPDGAWLATASGDHTARLWDTTTGKQLGEPLGHDSYVHDVAFSPDGMRLATASDDRTARLWDIATRKPLGQPLRHEGAVYQVTFSPDGTRLATASADRTARLWNASSGEPLSPSLRHKLAIYRVAFSPDGSQLVTASDTARLWDVPTGNPLGEPLRHEGPVRDVMFSSDGTRLATASVNAARLWEVGLERPLNEPLLHEDSVRHLCFSRDGAWLATASHDTTRVWDVVGRKPVRLARRIGGAVNCVAFSPNGTQLATTSSNTAQLWNVATGKPFGEPLQHEGYVHYVAYSPDGALVATLCDDKIRLWNVATAKPFGEPLRHEEAVYHIAFSRDGSRVATASKDKTARLWDVATGKQLCAPMHHESPVLHVAFSPDGARLATASVKTVYFWNGTTGGPLGVPLPHEGSVLTVDISQDWTRLALASGHAVLVWDLRTRKPLGEPLLHESEVSHVTFSPDGARLATVSDHNTARLWDVATGKPLGESMRHGGLVYYIAFSPDGARLATASADNTARLWDVAIAPVEPPSHLRLWAEVLTGAEMDDAGRIVPLSTEALLNKHKELKRLGGPPKEYVRILAARRHIRKVQGLKQMRSSAMPHADNDGGSHKR